MLKGLLATLAIGISVSASAAPWLELTKGNPDKDAKWASCHISEGTVSMKIWNKEGTASPIELDEAQFLTWITAAKAADWGTPAFHIMATYPAVTISVGDGTELVGTKIYVDSSNLQSRKGAAVDSLVQLAFEACGDLSL